MSEYSGDTNAPDNDLRPTNEPTAISSEISIMIIQLIQQNRDEDKLERSQEKQTLLIHDQHFQPCTMLFR